MKYQRRGIEGISLSFLDVISCGFGALILLLVLTKVYEPVIFEDTIENLEAYLANLQEDLFEIRGDSRELSREMIRREDRETDSKDSTTPPKKQRLKTRSVVAWKWPNNLCLQKCKDSSPNTKKILRMTRLREFPWTAST